LLIERGADIDAKNDHKETPLLYAAGNNNAEISRLLIERGADIRAKTSDNYTPILWATINNNTEIIQLLAEKRVKPLKPSKMFCKHGILLDDERSHHVLHNFDATSVEERCGRFYNETEINEMKEEIKNLKTDLDCVICSVPITEIGDCISCGHGHKFHKNCINTYWEKNPNKTNFCPMTNNIPKNGKWEKCKDLINIFSGGKKHKKSRKSNRKKKITT